MTLAVDLASKSQNDDPFSQESLQRPAIFFGLGWPVAMASSTLASVSGVDRIRLRACQRLH